MGCCAEEEITSIPRRERNILAERRIKVGTLQVKAGELSEETYEFTWTADEFLSVTDLDHRFGTGFKVNDVRRFLYSDSQQSAISPLGNYTIHYGSRETMSSSPFIHIISEVPGSESLSSVYDPMKMSLSLPKGKEFVISLEGKPFRVESDLEITFYIEAHSVR